jgi:hypothetical protein
VNRRSPWLLYATLLASGGLAGFAWIVLLMDDINQLEGKSVFAVKRFAFIFAIGACIGFLAFVFIAIAFAPGSTSKQIGTGLVSALISVLNLLLLVCLARVSLHAARSLGYRYPAMLSAAMVALFFVAAVSFPILQRQLNVLSERRRERGSIA